MLQIGVQLLALLAMADCRRLRVIRCQLKTLPVNITQLHDENSICCSSVIHKTEILTFYSRHLIKFNIISFAKSVLVLHHNIIHSRFCKTGYASLFGVGLHFLEYSPRNSFSNLKQHYSAALGLGALLRSPT